MGQSNQPNQMTDKPKDTIIDTRLYQNKDLHNVNLRKVQRFLIDEFGFSRFLNALNDKRAIVRHNLPDDVRIINTFWSHDYRGWWVHIVSDSFPELTTPQLIPEFRAEIIIEPIA